MKQTKRQSIQQNIEWILNLLDQIPKAILQQSNLRSITQTQLSRLQECDQVLQSTLYTYKMNKFEKVLFTLYPNMLVSEDNQYLVLSSCVLQKKVIQYKEFTAQGVHLMNNFGNLFLFYESYVQQLNWEKQLKRFSKQVNFHTKYTIQEKLSVQNHYACVKNKNNRPYTVQLVRLSTLNDQLYEALMNEINILMCFRQSGLHQFHAIFEDDDILYILYDYWVGDTLYKMIQQGFKITSQQIAQIIFQVMKVVRFLHQNCLYHGAILPTNIILHRQQTQGQLKISLFNFAYRDSVNLAWLSKRLPKQWIPPEFSTMQNMDVYQIGVLLYYLTFHQRQTQSTFQKSLEQFKIDYGWLTSSNTDYSVSLIELLCGLLHPDPESRINLTNALTHQWLTNQKHYLEKPKILPSLRTILELREQSSCDIVSSRYQVQETSSSEEGSDDEQIHRISKEKNKIPQYQQLLNLLPNKHPSRNYDQQYNVI